MNPTVDIDKPSFGALRGKNTYFHMPLSKLELWKPVFADIAGALEWGTRASVVIPGKGEAESAFTSLGFKVVHTSFFEDGARLTNQCWFRHSLPLTRKSAGIRGFTETRTPGSTPTAWGYGPTESTARSMTKPAPPRL